MGKDIAKNITDQAANINKQKKQISKITKSITTESTAMRNAIAELLTQMCKDLPGIEKTKSWKPSSQASHDYHNATYPGVALKSWYMLMAEALVRYLTTSTCLIQIYMDCVYEDTDSLLPEICALLTKSRLFDCQYTTDKVRAGNSQRLICITHQVK